MTLGTTTPVIDYVENGATTAHAIPFQFRYASEIKVTRTVAGVATVLTQGPDYAVAGGGGGTGTVNKANGGTNGATLRIERVTSRAQGVDLVPNGDFPAETNEQAFDRLSQVDQEQDFSLASLVLLAARALLVPTGEAGATVPALAARKGFYLKWDAATGLPVNGNPAADFVAPAITYVIDTLEPGAAATFAATGTWPNLTYAFGIPRGAPGTSGALGNGTYSGIVVTNNGANLDVVAGHITFARMANLAANSVIGNNSGAAAVPVALGQAALTAMINTSTTTLPGLAPPRPAAGATLYWLRGDNQYAKQPYDIPIACSDETSALTVGLAKVTFRMPRAMTLTAVRASLKTAQATGAIFTVNVKESGASIFGANKLTIDNAETTSVTAATAASLTDTALADDAEITVDIDVVGDGSAKGLKIWLIGTIG